MKASSDSALATARAIATGEVSAREVVGTALERIAARDPALNCFIEVTVSRALAEADAVDAARQRGETLGPLAGVPYAVKNLYDIAGLRTLAGARLFADRLPSRCDAPTVAELRKAGAVLVGTTNMDAYAYGFTTENSEYGVTRNPHDETRIAGGSSGGSAAAVAARMVAFSLGSDTNGSVRVPASFCGVFGLKPTYGRLPRDGTHAFVDSLDHLGLFARYSEDLACAYDVMQSAGGSDAAWAQRRMEPTLAWLEQGIEGLRVARLGGHFVHWADADASAGVARVAEALDAVDVVELPHADLARTSAFLITAAEGGERYLDMLRTRLADFEPLSKDRLLAGCMVPASWYIRAQRFRNSFREQATRLFQRYDVLLVPTTPCVAQPIGTESVALGDTVLPWRPNIGIFTQPISFIGLPAVSVPLVCSSGLPIGAQIISAPWKEQVALRVARHLERVGITAVPLPSNS